MFSSYIGEFAALSTAFCWAIASTSFEDAGKRIGSMNLNLMRLLIAIIFLSVFTLISRGYLLPTDADATTWFWLLLSGLIGFVIGDLLLFEAFVLVGARISMLIYASVPPLSGLMAFIFLGEAMAGIQILGMVVTIIGIALVIIDGDSTNKKMKFSHPVKGILFAFGGALGQAAGYIIGKFGMADYDAFAATQIRTIAGIIGFALLFTLNRQWKKFLPSFKEKKAMRSTTIGAIFGPFIGVSLSLFAVQRINPGVASTLTSITPVLLIPYSIFIKKEKIKVKEIIGSLVAIFGLGIMFM